MGPSLLCSSYTMGCRPVCGDNPRALASGLSYVQVDKHANRVHKGVSFSSVSCVYIVSPFKVYLERQNEMNRTKYVENSGNIKHVMTFRMQNVSYIILFREINK